MNAIKTDEIAWNRYAELHGFEPPVETFNRGGKIAVGSLRKMVKLSSELEAKGYYGLMIVKDGPHYKVGDMDQLRALLA